MEEVALTYPSYEEGAAPLELYVDASSVGAGACLMQMQDGEYKPIAYASMSFTETQKRYSTTERELHAIRFGVNQFRAFPSEHTLKYIPTTSPSCTYRICAGQMQD